MTRGAGDDGLRNRLDELLDELRSALHDSLGGMTEQEARTALVPSRTTLLSLVKHVTFVEAFWFGRAITGQSLDELGVAGSVERSWTVDEGDTIASVQQAFLQASARSREAVRDLALQDPVTGSGPRSLWQLHVQVVRELAQHAGHADILREQLLAGRTATS